MKTRLLLIVVASLACACGGSKGGSDAGAGADAGGADSNGTWTRVTPMDGASHQAQTVSGFWFSSQSSGVVTFSEGLVEHFSSATTIDAISLEGTGKVSNGDDDQYFGFIAGTSLGLVVRNFDATQLVTSSDQGKTFQYSSAFSQVTAPAGLKQDFPLMWTGQDSAGGWHLATAAGGGDVYSSSGPLGSSADLTLTWHPSGTVTVPATIPAGDCTDYVTDASDPGQHFAVTTDGSVFVYASGSSICRSSDHGSSFVDVSANISPSTFTSHHPPLGFLFTSASAGIAYYGSELDNPGTAYVLYTPDAGQSWTVATLPAVAQQGISLRYAFASPSGALFLVGGGAGLVLLKSTDGGKTWNDLSSKLSPWASGLENAPVRLNAGFALDDQHLWVGSDNGFIAYSATGGS